MKSGRRSQSSARAGGRRSARAGGRAGGRGYHVPTNLPADWQDVERHKQQLTENRAKKRMSGTREVKGPMFAPGPSDVQELIAAIAKIEQKEKLLVASDRLTSKDERHQPACSPTRENWRLSKVLDSIANLCVSETNHEVIATALRVDDNAQSIEVIVASNYEVKSSTQDHLRQMWNALQEISISCHKAHKLGPQNPTPSHFPPDPRRLKNKFRQLCLEFSFGKLQKRVNEKFSRFSAIDIDNMDESHPFQNVRKVVNVIEKHFTREKNPVIGKPNHNNEDSWNTLWACLTTAKDDIDKFLRAMGFRNGEMWRVPNFFEYDSYLRKIESFANDIKVLLKAANSPQCQHLFTFEFNVRALPIEKSQAARLPRTSKQWETVLENALLFRNLAKDDMEGNYLINIERVKEDTAYMAKEAVSQNLVVHCEVKLLTHIFETEPKITGTSKTYTYIGVSKLSCRGCQAFFKSFNAVHGTNFTTKGSHSKSYWPWQFPPQPFAERNEVLFFTYLSIAKRWVESYNGYKAKRDPFAPDSEPQSGSGLSDGSDMARAVVNALAD